MFRLADDRRTECRRSREYACLLDWIELMIRTLFFFLTPSKAGLIVIVETEVRNQVFASHPAQSILQLHQLNEQIMLRIEARSRHWAFKIEAQPLLYSAHSSAVCQIQKQHKVQN